VYLSFEDKKYWDHSFTEIGNYDIPAAIDYILEKTNKKKISAVAHSMGTSALVTAMADKSKRYYSKVLDSVVFLSPVVRMDYSSSLLGFSSSISVEL